MAIAYRLENTPWAPRVIDEGGDLKIVIGVDFNRGYDIREYQFAITEAQLDVIRTDLARHLLLWCAIEQLCVQAGRQDKHRDPDPRKAQSAIDVVLQGSADDVDAYFARNNVPVEMLIAHGANPELLRNGQLFAALGDNPSPTANQRLVEEDRRQREWARQGISVTPLDIAVLTYTNKYPYGGTLTVRKPDAVEPSQLKAVLEVIATAEQACAGIELPASKRYPDPTWKAARDALETAVADALGRVYPTLTDDAVEAVGWLMSSEAGDRARAGEGP